MSFRSPITTSQIADALNLGGDIDGGDPLSTFLDIDGGLPNTVSFDDVVDGGVP